MTDYLRPKGVNTRNLNKRTMEDEIFKNPPLYTVLGGFTSVEKFTDPAGKRNRIAGMNLEGRGPTAEKGKPI